jgi:DNA-binding MarR family transcriptional regulator
MNENSEKSINKLMEMFLQMRRLFQHEANEASETCSFTSLQFETLNYINEKKICTMKQISDFLGISMSGATQLIERLHDNKLIERVLDNEDRRIVKITLTKIGILELRRLRMFMNKLGNDIFKELTEEEINEYLKTNQLILQNIKNLHLRKTA